MINIAHKTPQLSKQKYQVYLASYVASALRLT